MFNIKTELKKVPEKPGIYLMKDKTGKIIYVGKARVLKKRIRQYFRSLKNVSSKTKVLVSQISSFDYIITDSELEALVLECNLIKKYRPKFNVLLKDDKNYPYIKITMKEYYPRILITRRRINDNAKYFGPYSNTSAVKNTVSFLKKLFPLQYCNKVFDGKKTAKRPCLNYHIKKCPGLCCKNINQKEYLEVIKSVCDFLSGKHESILKDLEKKMHAYSKNMEYEKAAVVRDRIESIRHVKEKQKALSLSMENQDVIALEKDADKACIQVMFIRKGKLIGKEHFFMEKIKGAQNKEVLSSFIKQFYNLSTHIPKIIILQESIGDLKVIEKWLSDKRGSKISIKVPVRGHKKQLINMTAKNAKHVFNNMLTVSKGKNDFAKQGPKIMAEILGFEKVPERVEAYDISNIGSSDIVASMIVFEKGVFVKDQYRKFRIKSVLMQDDYSSMREVILRRLKYLSGQENNEKTNKFGKKPDVILIDGGKGHVNAVQEILNTYEINIDVLGMVKDEKHRTRGLIAQNKEYSISNNMTLLRFISSIQNEAHRFAINYSRKLRQNRNTKSELSAIKGVGEKRRKALIKHFGSIEKIKKAKVKELADVDSININVAESIYQYFNGG